MQKSGAPPSEILIVVQGGAQAPAPSDSDSLAKLFTIGHDVCTSQPISSAWTTISA